MIHSTQIARLDGLMLLASMDQQDTANLTEIKSQIRQILKRLTPSSEPRASLESSQYNMHYLLANSVAFFAITERSYPKKLAQTYLKDISDEFFTTHRSEDYLSPTLRPYAYNDFERFIERTKTTYQDSRATENLTKLNTELKDVAQVMTKNIEDLLYRGDSLERMGDMSSRLREDSAKYKRAAVRINWELLLKQYGPFAALGLIILVFILWRFVL